MHLIHSNGIVLYYFLYLVLFLKKQQKKLFISLRKRVKNTTLLKDDVGITGSLTRTSMNRGDLGAYPVATTQ